MSRRRVSDAPFGSDSFLDILANLVGIVLIMIVLVGARIRQLPLDVPAEEPSSLPAHTGASSPVRAEMLDLQADPNPEQQELDELRDKVFQLAEMVTQHVIALESAKQARNRTADQVREQEQRIAAVRAAVDKTEALLDHLRKDASAFAAARDNLRARLEALNWQLRGLEAPRVEKQALRYFLPVSRPLGAGELMFECRANRITFVDLQTLLNQVRQRLPELAKQLADKWETMGETEPVGPFKLRYKVVRERSSPVDQVFDGLPPADNRAFSYALDEWEVVPLWPERGETVEEALADGSRFRAVVEATDPDVAALTFFVYEDSFSTFRRVREYLHERGYVVAGRPLRMDAPMAGSRRGSVSRGQ